MINNFAIIKEYIKNTTTFEKNDFFFVQIIKRRKDNPEMIKDQQNIDNFYLYSIEDFEKYEERIIESCKLNNARCLIRISKRNMEELASRTIILIAEAQAKKQYHLIPSAFSSACGKFSAGKNFWMIDVDDMSIFEEVNSFIQTVSKIHLIVPTKNGCHIIINGFNPDLWIYDIKDKRVELKTEATTNLIC